MTNTPHERKGRTKMCLIKDGKDICRNGTILFIIVLLSLKLCSPQDLNEDFVADESIDPMPDMFTMDKVNFQRDSSNDGPCRLSELLCDTGQCISLDKYCNGEDDCGDKSDEPKSCTRKYF